MTEPSSVSSCQLPVELRELPNWVSWRLDPPDEPDGKPKKVPINPHTGGKASPTNPATWGSFEQAKARAEGNKLAGVGFCFEGSGYTGVDLDDCVAGGVIESQAMEIITALNSYTEFSQSGEGVHIIGKGSLPTGARRKGNIEAYDSGRYFIMTGYHVGGTPTTVEDRHSELETFHAQYLGGNGHRETASVPATTTDDSVIIEKMLDSKSGAHIRQLLDGDTSAHEGDDSAADMALCSHLAFWCGKYASQMDRIFRSSGLMRDKWDSRRGESTYGAQTIQRAIDRCSEVYTAKSETTENENATSEVEGVADYGHAQVLASLLAGRFRWASHRKVWLKYQGGVWKTVGDERLARIASETLRRHYGNTLAQAKRKEDMDRLAKLVRDSCTMAKIQGALSFLKGWDGFYTEAAEWDSDSWLFNCRNGVLELKTLTFKPHNPDFLCTKQAGVSYEPDIGCPQWRAHLERFLPDANVRRQVQRSLGVALVGAVLEEKLDLWHGTGKNGKSTTQRPLLYILGDYAGVCAPNLLVASKHERHPAELADLAGNRLLFSSETEANRRLAEALVKQVTGGEPIKARHMYGHFFTFERTFSTILITNHKPRILGQDNAIWRRIRFIPWNETIVDDERRPQDELVSEFVTEEGTGILNWLLEGLQDWQENPQWVAPEVVAATDAYRSEQDAIGGFLADFCEFGPRYVTGVSELYEAYTRWCEESGEEPLNKKVFGTTLKSRGIDPGRSKTTRQWVGVRLRVTDGDGRSVKSLHEGDSRKVVDKVSPCVTLPIFEDKNPSLPHPAEEPGKVEILNLWHELGKPPISLRSGETNSNLESLLSNKNASAHHMPAIHQWYQSNIERSNNND